MNEVWIEGIDVSHWQGVIDWRQVSKSGCRFAFMKATEGATYTDRTFAENYFDSAAVGILGGAYHYFRSTSTVKAQIEHFVQTVGVLGSNPFLSVLDVEDPKQWQGKSPTELSEMVIEWLTGIEQQLQIRPIIYLSPSFADQMLAADRRLCRFPLWLAHWTDGAPIVPQPWTDWTFWQYSSKGRIDGITENVVDLDRFNGDVEALRALFERI
jgi:lysozyme